MKIGYINQETFYWENINQWDFLQKYAYIFFLYPNKQVVYSEVKLSLWRLLLYKDMGWATREASIGVAILDLDLPHTSNGWLRRDLYTLRQKVCQSLHLVLTARTGSHFSISGKNVDQIWKPYGSYLDWSSTPSFRFMKAKPCVSNHLRTIGSIKERWTSRKQQMLENG